MHNDIKTTDAPPGYLHPVVRAPVHHVIKCWPPFFDEVGYGRKTFELRRDDRDYQVGDSVELREWCPVAKDYTQRWIWFRISYVLRAKDAEPFGLLQPDACVLGIKLPANHTWPPGCSNATVSATEGRQ